VANTINAYPPDLTGPQIIIEQPAPDPTIGETKVAVRLQGPASYGPIDNDGRRVARGETIYVPASKVDELLGVGFVKVDVR
jgi:hypothetical protein